jgi:hypothetical protein
MLPNRSDLFGLKAIINRATSTIRDAIAAAGRENREAIAENTNAINQALDLQISREEADRYYAEHNRPNGLQWWTFAVAIASFIVLIWYAFTTQSLWREAAEANRISRSNAIAANRAFVFFSPQLPPLIAIKQKPDSTSIWRWRFQIPMENSGATPTSGMHNHVSVYPSATTLDDKFAFPNLGDYVPIPVVLGPKQTLYSVPLDIDSNVLADVRNGSRYLYFYGWACYHDTFAATPMHMTRFCYEMTAFHGNPFKIPTPNDKVIADFRIWPRYNCSDDDCAKDPAPNPCP